MGESTPGTIDVRPAMAFFMIGAVHLALMFMVLKVTTTMVSGWSVFGLARSDRVDERGGFNTTLSASAAPVLAPALTGATARERAAQSTPPPARDIRVSAAMPAAANDTGGSTTIRETRVVQGATAYDQGRSGSASPSRARGIGSRFRSAPVRSSEKMQ